MTENKSICTKVQVNVDLIEDENPAQARISQADKFKELARQIEADEDDAHWEGRLKAIARQKPKNAPEKPE